MNHLVTFIKTGKLHGLSFGMGKSELNILIGPPVDVSVLSSNLGKIIRTGTLKKEIIRTGALKLN